MATNTAVNQKTPSQPPQPPTPRPGDDHQHHRAAPSILFTAFEPSGDAHAAPVIRELLRRVPMLKVYAWGGPKMEAAGATLLGRTADDGTMGLGAFKKVFAVRREVKRIKQWAKQYRVLAHVAVDSPAANFPICKAMKKTGARIIHLVAPQMWAWGSWRVGKLRRLTDLVLCLLPHEEQWFSDRNVPAKFIGHPMMNRELDPNELRDRMHGLPQGAPRVAIFPGSRSQEVKANIRLLVNAYTEMHGRHAGMTGVIVAANQNLARIVRKKVKVFPSGLHMITAWATEEKDEAKSSPASKTAGTSATSATSGSTGTTPESSKGGGAGDFSGGRGPISAVDAAIAWCDLALAVSGTITMDIARQRKPMVGVYRGGLITWLGAKLLVRSYALLPNVIADREIVPEFAPHIGGAMPIVKAAGKYLLDSRNAANTTEELNRVCLRFANKKPAEEAARLIIKVLKDGMVETAKK